MVWNASYLRSRGHGRVIPDLMTIGRFLFFLFLLWTVTISISNAEAEFAPENPNVHPGEYVVLTAILDSTTNITIDNATLEIIDAHGQILLILTRPVSEDGCCTLRFRIPVSAPKGEYTAHLSYLEDNQPSFEQAFFNVTPKEPKPGNPLLLWGSLCFVGISFVALASIEYTRYSMLLLLLPLFSRLNRNTILDNKTRLAIHGIIIENPGIHYKAIMREFDLTNGEAVYHLQVLEREDFIRSVRDGRLRRFYSKLAKVPEGMRLTPDKIRERIQDLVIEHPGISQREIVVQLGLGRDTVGYHLRELTREGYLDAERRGRYTVYRSKRLT